ncbi:MAG TPA: hypothetical protein VGA69_05290 [Nitriliruptorales bacterium]
MTRQRRTAVGALAALVALAVSSACGTQVTVRPIADGHQASAPVPMPPDELPAAPDLDAELQPVLDALAAGFLAADPEAIRPHLLDPSSAFGARWLARAANLAEVPLATYELELDPSLPDLATGAVRDRHVGAATVRYVRERHALAGYDEDGPAAEDLFLTFVHAEDRWRVAGDTDAEPLGLVSADHLWDHGPVEVTVDGPLVALHHPGTPAIGPVLAEARAALGDVLDRWPLEWPSRVPIIVPRDEDELAELLHVTFDLSSFVAFATASPVGELGEYRLTGSRVILNPVRFLNRASGTRRLILAHELLHVATRPVAGPFTPAWVEEGVAQAIGEQRSTTGLGILDGLVARGAFDALLPTDAQFVTGGRDRIFLSYQLAYSFVSFLVDTYGVDAVARWYRELGRGSVGRPGRESWHVQRSVQEVFDLPLDELRQQWAARLAPG